MTDNKAEPTHKTVSSFNREDRLRPPENRVRKLME
jgi:hypothetical protein